MKIRSPLRLCRLARRLSRRRDGPQTTRYAQVANEMAGRNLANVLRPRQARDEVEIIAACLEAGFPLLADEEAPERLREAVSRIEAEGREPRD